MMNMKMMKTMLKKARIRKTRKSLKLVEKKTTVKILLVNDLQRKENTRVRLNLIRKRKSNKNMVTIVLNLLIVKEKKQRWMSMMQF